MRLGWSRSLSRIRNRQVSGSSPLVGSSLSSTCRGVPCTPNSSGRDLPRIANAAESQRAGTIHARRHQQQFSVFLQAIGLGEVPDGALRLVVTSAAKYGGAGVLVDELFRPLPDVADQVHHAERTGSFRMCVDRIGTAHGAGLVGHRNRTRIPVVAPRIEAFVNALRPQLPFPLTGQALSGPAANRSSS